MQSPVVMVMQQPVQPMQTMQAVQGMPGMPPGVVVMVPQTAQQAQQQPQTMMVVQQVGQSAAPQQQTQPVMMVQQPQSAQPQPQPVMMVQQPVQQAPVMMALSNPDGTVQYVAVQQNVQPGFSVVEQKKAVFLEDPVQCVCPHCNQLITTKTKTVIGQYPWVLCFGMSVIGCFLFSWIPCCIPAFHDVEHVCPNCLKTVGTLERMRVC
eukprot:TRINITY_DN555_c0_g1_i1.p1 TRINITY_DN555_c0_g1~~TRINITY_DN555_c0_g1_i1.p1  ORF type:complete len:231 (+),score=46.02 TRINITY_DN555_c0_g1_i1:71-694(+)